MSGRITKTNITNQAEKSPRIMPYAKKPQAVCDYPLG
jgi:hypothetical protein